MRTNLRTNIRGASARIGRLEEFTAGGATYNAQPNFRGVKHRPGTYACTGAMPDSPLGPGHPTDVSNADYIVYSYATPIAWHVSGGGWMVPDYKYSRSTTRHQSAVWSAISPAWDVTRGTWKEAA